MNLQFKFVKNYKDNDKLRESLNSLAESIFDGLSFEKWYKSGYWKDNYIPYSIVYKEKIIANASANIMDMIKDGSKKKYIQIGTVMTDNEFRNKGLSKYLINKIIEDYKNEAEGIYLWANDSAVNFYPKLGFTLSKEFTYKKEVSNRENKTAIQINIYEGNRIKLLEDAMKNSINNSSFESKNYDLIFFYIINFMESCIYYIPEADAYVIAEIYNDTLQIDNIFSKNIMNIDSIIRAFGKEIRNVILGFTPINKEGYKVVSKVEENSHFFVMGNGFIDFSKEKKSFPALSHG